jgi:hypothetical protein
MKIRWRRGANPNAGEEGLGLESVRFDLLGLTRQPDVAPNHRYWLGRNLGVDENWFPIPPDLPSLQEDEIRATYEALIEDQPDADGRMPRLLHVSVHHETPLPVVFTLIRVPDDRRYAFVGAITLPLAECSWVIKVQSSEGSTTGIRETLAGARFRKQYSTPESSIEHLASHFDPYDAQWDLDENDPLTLVRQSTNKVLASLEVDAEVRRATPFRWRLDAWLDDAKEGQQRHPPRERLTTSSIRSKHPVRSMRSLA